MNETLFKDSYDYEKFKANALPENIANHQSHNGDVELRPEDLEVVFFEINSGMGSKDPFDSIRFYQQVGQSN